MNDHSCLLLSSIYLSRLVKVSDGPDGVFILVVDATSFFSAVVLFTFYTHTTAARIHDYLDGMG
jgi:hypothetical protein